MEFVRSFTLVKLVLILLVSLQFCCARLNRALVHESDSEPGLCAEMILIYGYPCEEHVVTTPDGFELGVQHIPNGIKGDAGLSKAPVFLQHGLIQGGDDYFLNGPKESLGFILADAGFDVWVGNTRASAFSASHKFLKPTNEAYWNWTFDQLISYDLPTVLQFVHSKTGLKIHYIGHSQGSLMALGALSGGIATELFAASVLMAPIAYLNNTKAIFDKTAANYYLDTLLNLQDAREFNPLKGIGLQILNFVCGTDNFVCRAFWAPASYFNYTRVSYYSQYEPQPCSTINIVHFAQLIRTGLFQKYDYGKERNMLQYSQENPPLYDVSKIPSEVSFLLAYGGIDALSDEKDVENLIGDLKCQVKTLFLQDYGHSDFILGMNAYKDVYNPIIQYLRENKQ